MGRRSLRSISVPIILASTAVALAVALLVGWTLIFADNLARGEDLAANVWLLVLGVVAFVAIMSVLVMFAVFLARKIIQVRRQDSFIDSVTHELKSPLASIKLGLQTMGRDGVGEEKRELLRGMMLGDVDRLSAFIDDVLQASRLADGRSQTPVNLAPIEVSSLLHECAAMVTEFHKLEAHAIAIDAPTSLEMTSDRASLQVVVRNLLDNAVKYSTAPIRVSAKAQVDERGGLVLEVVDSGIGIPKRDLRRVFQRFYRVEDESVRSRKGTGLGLFVVSALVRDLGGRVEAESEGRGAGTTMRVMLPSGASSPARA